MFNMCIKESCFLSCRKVSSMVPVFKNIWESSTAESYCLARVFYLDIKIFEKCESNRLKGHVEKSEIIFLISNMVSGLLIQMQIFWQLIKSLWLSIVHEPLELYHLIYPRLHELTFYIISYRVFGLILSFLGSRQLQVVLDVKALQEYPVSTGAS